MERVNPHDAITYDRFREYVDRVRSMTSGYITTTRLDLSRMICNNLLLSISTWPREIRVLFFKRPLGVGDTARLFWFLLGMSKLISYAINVTIN